MKADAWEDVDADADVDVGRLRLLGDNGEGGGEGGLSFDKWSDASRRD